MEVSFIDGTTETFQDYTNTDYIERTSYNESIDGKKLIMTNYFDDGNRRVVMIPFKNIKYLTYLIEEEKNDNEGKIFRNG